MMCCGKDPYKGQTPAMVIFAKASRASGRGQGQHGMAWHGMGMPWHGDAMAWRGHGMAWGMAWQWHGSCMMLCWAGCHAVLLQEGGQQRLPGLPPAGVQVRVSKDPTDGRLPPIEGIPKGMQQLIWDCTAHDKHNRRAGAEGGRQGVTVGKRPVPPVHATADGC